MAIVLALATFILCIAIDGVVTYLAWRRRMQAAEHPQLMRAMHAPNPPFGLFVDDGHAWIRLANDGTVRVGVDDFLTEAVGDVRAVGLPPLGRTVERGDPLLQLDVNGRKLVVPSPAAGEVVGANTRLGREPGLLTSDPYGLGWAVSLRTRDLKAALAPLHLGQGGNGFLQNELRRFLDLLTLDGRSPVDVDNTGGLVLADGGLPTVGTLATASDRVFEAFQKEFLPIRRNEPDPARE